MVLLTCVIFAATAAASAQCPTLTVVGPAGITNPGDEMTFRAELNAIGPKVSYSWSVTAGTIVKGQGTSEIAIATTSELAGSSIKATVEVIDLPPTCERVASETAGIAERIECGLPADEWGELRPNDERGRLDMFFAELMNNPDNVGLVLLRTKGDERLDPANKRIQFVLRHIKFRKFNKNRIWFALEVAEEKLTRLYRIPPGAEAPCSECLIFRGDSL